MYRQQKKTKNPKYLTSLTKRLAEKFNQKTTNYQSPLNSVITKKTITNEDKHLQKKTFTGGLFNKRKPQNPNIQ